MAKHSVEAPIDKVKELILLDYPNYYLKTEVVKKDLIGIFVKSIHHDVMYEYMEKTKDGEVDDS